MAQVTTRSGKHGKHSVITYAGHSKAVHTVAAPVHEEPVHVVHHSTTRYAYPISIFMPHPPEFEKSLLPEDQRTRISNAFDAGTADEYAARSLVRAGVVDYHPLYGGIFWRREPVKYIILHSTEPGVPQSATRIVDSWSSRGIRHPGAQYVVDRDGTIVMCVDPDLATVHINIFKTLPGINNDNSIGIEMCHTGSQTYPIAQRNSVMKLVTYLQQRYKVVNDNVITHRYAQQGDHTDPVNFDLPEFIATKDTFRNRAIAYRLHETHNQVKDIVVEKREPSEPQAIAEPATTYLQPHRYLPVPPEIKVEKVLTTTISPKNSNTSATMKSSEVTSVTQQGSSSESVPLPGETAAPPTAPTLAPPSAVEQQKAPDSSNIKKSPTSLRGPMELLPGAVPGLNVPAQPTDPESP